jgi:curli biogenesis system outer membrane secretion channel CsgG
MQTMSLRILSLLAVVLSLGACTTANVVSSSGGPTIQQAQAAPYNGPKKRIAISAFEDKATKYGGLGRGVTDMLADSLFNTNRFIVLERDRLNDVIQEQDMADTGRFRESTVAPKGKLEGAELLIRGSITQFEPSCRGGSLLLIGAKEACVTINLRIIDTTTGRIVNSTTVEGTSGSAGIGLIFTSAPLPVGLGAWSKTPMETALRNCIETAVHHIVDTKL